MAGAVAGCSVVAGVRVKLEVAEMEVADAVGGGSVGVAVAAAAAGEGETRTGGQQGGDGRARVKEGRSCRPWLCLMAIGFASSHETRAH